MDIARHQTSLDAEGAVGFAERLATVCSRMLGEAVSSVILHGSLVLGDYQPGASDVDLLAIVDRRLTRSEIDRLVRAVVAAATSALAAVDLRVVTREVAATPPEAPPMELYVRQKPGARPEIVSHDPGEPDVVVELSLCRDRGSVLIGSEPVEVIGEVPDESVLRAGDAQLAHWQRLTDDAPYAELMALTACRIWRFSEERVHCSKSAAGAWALARDPALRAVRNALRQRRGEATPIAPAELGRVLAIAREAVAVARRRRDECHREVRTFGTTGLSGIDLR
jgi:Domain of unknown function (DUF4111)/Nucleotidyltransferase domain